MHGTLLDPAPWAPCAPCHMVSHRVTPCSHGCHGMSQAEMAKAGGLGSKVALTSAVHGQRSRMIKNDQDKLHQCYTDASEIYGKLRRW